MTGPCYYHPDAPAVDTCVQCGMSICQQCRDRVAEKTVCRKCVGAVRARLEQQMAAGGPQTGAAAPQNLTGSPAYAAASGPAAYAAAKPDSGRLLMAIGLALVIGIVATIAIEKILFFTGLGLSLLYIAMGYGIGYGLHSVLGRGGSGLALLACGLMVVCLVVGELFYAQDIINVINSKGGGSTLTFAEILPRAIQHHGIMHWVCILFGLMACYRGVEQHG